MRSRALDAAALTNRLHRRTAGDPLLEELRRLAEGGKARLCVVGGYVRDAALGRESGEVDLVASARCATLVGAVQLRWRTRGHRFRKRGVTTWRFRLGERMVDIVDASRRGIERDLRRRDLTINAMAFDLGLRILIDPVGGRADLRAGRLRPPETTAFRDDPLRALRLCRSISELPGFSPTREARRGASAASRALRRCASERVYHELDKLLLGRRPRGGLEALESLGLRSSVLPELDDLVRCPAGRGRPDVWTHTIDAVRFGASARGRRLPGARHIDGVADRRVLLWGLLLHDISKPETLTLAPDGRPTFHGHEVVGERRANSLLRRLRQPVAIRRRVGRLVRLHLRPGHLADGGPTTRSLRRLARDAGEDLPLLTVHAAADARASGAPDSRRRWNRLRSVLWQLLEISTEIDTRLQTPLIDGRDVMRALSLQPGPEVGRLLELVREAQADGLVRTRRQALAFLTESRIRSR